MPGRWAAAGSARRRAAVAAALCLPRAPRLADAVCPSDSPSALGAWLHSTGYDPQRLPGGEGYERFETVTQVIVNPLLVSVTELNTQTQTYKFNVYLRLEWFDERLTWNETELNCSCCTPVRRGCCEQGQVVINKNSGAEIWQPDVYMDNAVDMKFVSKDYDAGEQFTKVSSHGEAFRSMRVVVTLSCKMDFNDYPFDKQVCSTGLLSYAFNASTIQLVPGSGIGSSDDGSVVLKEEEDEGNVGAYWLKGVNMVQAANVTFKDSGVFSKVDITSTFVRAQRRVLLTMLLPLWLVVFISVLGLFIDNKAAPARVAMGITTVLVLITLLLTLSKDVPVVVYTTALDSYIAGCLAYVVFNCAVYSLVNYLFCRVKKHCEDIDQRHKLRMGVVDGLSQVNSKSPSHAPATTGSSMGMEDDAEASRMRGYSQASSYKIATDMGPRFIAFNGQSQKERARKQELFEEFRLWARPNGCMDPRDLSALLQGVTRHHHRIPDHADLQRWSMEADADGDGELDFNEFKALVGKNLRWLTDVESRAVMVWCGCCAMTYYRICWWEDLWRKVSPHVFVFGTLLWLTAKAPGDDEHERAWCIAGTAAYCVAVVGALACRAAVKQRWARGQRDASRVDVREPLLLAAQEGASLQ